MGRIPIGHLTAPCPNNLSTKLIQTSDMGKGNTQFLRFQPLSKLRLTPSDLTRSGHAPTHSGKYAWPHCMKRKLIRLSFVERKRQKMTLSNDDLHRFAITSINIDNIDALSQPRGRNRQLFLPGMNCSLPDDLSSCTDNADSSILITFPYFHIDGLMALRHRRHHCQSMWYVHTLQTGCRTGSYPIPVVFTPPL